MVPESGNVTRMKSYRGKVDRTGESVTTQIPARSRRRRGWREHVSLIDLDTITKLDMTGSELRVLFAIARFIPERGGTEARVSITEVADTMGIAEQNVSRTFRTLRARHIVRSPRRGVHEINPWILFNGDFESWNVETSSWPEPVWERVDAKTGEVRS